MMFDDEKTIEVTAAPAAASSSAGARGAAAGVAEAVTSGEGLSGFARVEARWLAGMFVRVALSIAIWRTLRWMWAGDDAQTRRHLYDNAASYWKGGRMGPDAYSTGGFSRPAGSGPRPGNGNGEASYAEARDKRFVGQSGPYRLYRHDTFISPAQKWPCPVLYRHPCEGCSFHARDKKGRYHCAAVVKLRMIERGDEENPSIEEIVEWIEQNET